MSFSAQQLALRTSPAWRCTALRILIPTGQSVQAAIFASLKQTMKDNRRAGYAVDMSKSFEVWFDIYDATPDKRDGDMNFY